jgi:hypothetical protein
MLPLRFQVGQRRHAGRSADVVQPRDNHGNPVEYCNGHLVIRKRGLCKIDANK